MKIVVFSHTSSFYGAPNSIYELTNELRKKHDIIYIIPGHGQFEKKLKEENYRYFIAGNPNWIIPTKPYNYSNWLYLKHFIKESLLFLFNIISAYHVNKGIIKKIKPDYIIINTSIAPLGIILANKFHIPSILWIREPICNKKGWKIQTILPKRIVGRITNKANIILGPSYYIKDYIDKTFGIKRLQVLPNIISYEPKIVGSEPCYTFGMVGSVSERKGQYAFAKAMIENDKNATLIIWGGMGNEYSKKVKYLAEENKGRIIFGGYETELDKIYSSFNIYVNMGIDETFGRTTIEAMRAGKLVFGRNSGATPELIRHGENGFLFDNPINIFNILKEHTNIENKTIFKQIKNNAVKYSMQFTPDKISKNFNKMI